MATSKKPAVETGEVVDTSLNISSVDLSNILAKAITQAVATQASQPVKPAVIENEQDYMRIQQRHAKFYNVLAADQKNMVDVEIPKLYVPYIGQNLTVSVNGSTVKIPVDGRRHRVHQCFVGPIKEKLNHIGEKVSKSQNRTRNGQVGDIFEHVPH